MFLKNILKTFVAKVLVLLANFAVLILTTNYLGTEGRGIISIMMADLAIIVIFNNILGGSTVVYHIPKVGFSKLLLPAYIWIIISTGIASFVFSIFNAAESQIILFFLTFITSFLALNQRAFVGNENIHLFNVFSFLPPVLFLVFNLIFIYLVKTWTVNTYFLAYFLSQLLVFGFSFFFMKPYLEKSKIGISKKLLVSTFNYGWKNELSYFLQFLNYRLSYFLILFYLDLDSVGLFSVAVSVSESVWLIAKSITTVQYSKIVNLDNYDAAVALTHKSLKISLYATLFLLVVLAFIPSSIFGMIFGRDFTMVKELLLLLMPGILAIALSNVYGHFFAALNKMKFLVIKSSIGLVVTILLSVILIPLWGLTGACIVTSASYVSSSAYLFITFYKTKKQDIVPNVS